MNNLICDDNLCSGCGACLNICPTNCIKFIEDELECIQPYINNDDCIHCNMCKKVCPQLSKSEFHVPIKCYASHIKNHEKRLDSASGGIARAFYEYCILNIKNSKVTGVYFDADFQVKFMLTDKLADIPKFQGSKYIQAYPDFIYKQIYEELKKENFVLFIAMPCQVAALKNYLFLKNMSQDNLLTVDILCHGVCPQSYFNQNLTKIKHKLRLKKIEKISFRSNRKYKNYHLYIRGINKNNKEKIYNKYAYEEPYFYGFLKGTTLRESCYQCKYSQTNRVGDITIGDFLGLAQMPNSPKFEGNPVNLSMILCNTEKGEKFVSKLANDIKLYERPYKEAVEGGASLQKPFPKHKLRNIFIKNYKKNTFISRINKIAFWDLLFYSLRIMYKKIYVYLFMRDLLK